MIQLTLGDGHELVALQQFAYIGYHWREVQGQVQNLLLQLRGYGSPVWRRRSASGVLVFKPLLSVDGPTHLLQKFEGLVVLLRVEVLLGRLGYFRSAQGPIQSNSTL